MIIKINNDKTIKSIKRKNDTEIDHTLLVQVHLFLILNRGTSREYRKQRTIDISNMCKTFD